MRCTNCHGDIGAWLKKYRQMKKVRLDELYFKEEKLLPKFDENGIYISGELFFAHESKRCFERCPKCGSKNSVRVEHDDVTWAPI